MLAPLLDVALPDAGFYLWAGVPRAADGAPGDDIAFARQLLAQYNVAVLPGSLLARDAHGSNPGRRPHPHGPGGRHGRMPGGGPPHRRFHPRWTQTQALA